MSGNLTQQIEELTSIGISLSSERNMEILMEKILLGAKRLTHADGGTFYRVIDKHLHFEILRTDSIGFSMGGSTGVPVQLAPIPLFTENGQPNMKNISTHAAITGNTINVPDAYKAEGFDFSGTRRYDEANKYRSTSFLTIPLENHEGSIIGILQLINSTDESGKVVPFSLQQQKLAESLASQAAIAMSNSQLIGDLKNLLEKFIEVIASAIDEKSPYTGGHCRRVPAIANLLAESVNDMQKGPLKDVQLNESELYELNIAALLHDCGKITTPVHVVDKGTKLETIYDRLEVVKQRLLNIKKDEKINLLEILLKESDPLIIEEAQQKYRLTLEQIDKDIAFLETANKGSEFMQECDKERVKEIGTYQWVDDSGEKQNLLTENEIYNLCIERGTLTPEERTVINNHIVMTQKMLKALPLPNSLKNVAEIAGNHHERMDGKGYPNGLKGEEMSLQARMMCIADIFEALTASDRPYKKAMPLSVALDILSKMKDDNHIDPDLFEVFMEQKVYLKYGKDFLSDDQLDIGNENSQFPKKIKSAKG